MGPNFRTNALKNINGLEVEILGFKVWCGFGLFCPFNRL